MRDATTTGTPPPTLPVAFSGRRGELARIVVVNTLLTVVTLGIYRFWAKTALREYYWGRTAVGGDAFEYTGRGVELFLGFLIALVVLTILSVIVGVVQFYVGLGDPATSQGIELLVYAVVAWLLGYAVFRARRYRLTRTLWRGIRFGQDGSAARYAWLRFGWLLLLVLSLGIVRPWHEVALRRYEMMHTRFGFTHFAYAGRGRDLFRWWWPALLALAAMALGVALFGVGVYGAWQDQPAGLSAEDRLSAALDLTMGTPIAVSAVLLLAGAAIAFVLLNVRYRIAALRYLFAVTTLQGVSARSRAHPGRVLLYACGAGGVIAGLLVLGALLAAVAEGVGILIFVVAFLSLGLVNQLFFVFPLVRHVCATLATSDLGALDDIVQATRDDPRFGEGLLDALDFDMGVV